MGKYRPPGRSVVRLVARRLATLNFGPSTGARDVTAFADHHVEMGAARRDDRLRLHIRSVAQEPIGYHDGYMRALSNRANAIVRGTFAPVVGRVSMDLTLIDVTNVSGVEVGDKVTLLGWDREHPGPDISAEDLARTAGTLSYEVTCGIGERVPRLYVQ